MASIYVEDTDRVQIVVYDLPHQGEGISKRVMKSNESCSDQVWGAGDTRCRRPESRSD